MKKIIFLMLFAIIGWQHAFAQNFSNGGLFYNVTSPSTVEVAEQYGVATGIVIIPVEVTYNSNTYSVTSIRNSAFAGCNSLTSVSIPNSVNNISQYTFNGCSGLISVIIPNSVFNIDEYAFRSCSSLTSINIPNSVTSIGAGAFKNCSGLASINIPNSVTIIRGGTFEGCSGLTSVNIPTSVTSIGEGAFEYCNGLTSINIPNSVTSIGYAAFAYCAALTSVNIPNSVINIGDYAFSQCSVLNSVTIGNSVTSIGGEAFSYCFGLTSLSIGSSVTYIGSQAFRNCSNLTSVTCNIISPLSINDSVFLDVNQGACNLFVPAGSVAAYQSAPVWTDFIIVEMSVPAPTANPQTFCNGATVNDLVGSGQNLKWYDVATNGSPLFGNVALVSGTYYVSQTINGVESARTAVIITVNPNVTPTFTAVAPSCSGASLSALPTTSTNGISGTWSPAINNFATTTYTFTPTVGLCATAATMTISIFSTSLTASISSLNTSFACSGNQTTLLFNGTPNAIVTFNSSENVGPPYQQVTLDSNGTATYLTPPINNTTIFNLIKVESSGCSNNLSGFVKVSLTYANNPTADTGSAFVKVEGPDVICKEPDALTPQALIDISATYNAVKTTSSYLVKSIPYQPQYNFESPNTIPIPPAGSNQDDFWSGSTNTAPYNLPFKFEFYGSRYDKLSVGSNGVLSFNLTYQTSGAICPYVFPDNIPNINAPIKNAIFGVYQDINFSALATPTSSINYYIYPPTGSVSDCPEAKNRVFVMNTNKVYLYGDSTGASSGLQMYQIIMYETTNIIDVIVKRRQNSTNWQNRLGIIGIINAAGDQAIAAPGRNRNDAWNSTTGEAWRFIPNGVEVGGPKYTLKWYKNSVFYTEELNPIVLSNGQLKSTIQVIPSEGDIYTSKLDIAGFLPTDPHYILQDAYVVKLNEPKFKKPDDLTVFSTNSNGDFVFNINQNSYMANGVDVNNFDFGYFNSLQDARDFANPIFNIDNFVVPANTVFPKKINVNASDMLSGCTSYLEFNLFGSSSPQGTFSYPDDGGAIGFCRSSNTTLVPTELTPLTTGGVYSILPSNGIVINSNTGVIDLTDAVPGDYIVTYQIAGTGNNIPYLTTAPLKIILCTDMAPITTVCGGSTFTLSTTDAGLGVTYTWSDATASVIATTTLPTLPNIIAPTAGGSYAYSVIANYGTFNSTPSTQSLIVNPLPTITVQPQPTTVLEGAADVVLSITATGESLSYQWNDGTNNVGANSNSLNVPATLANNGKCYTCTVTDSCGVVVTSLSACVIISTLGTKNENAKLGIQLYPNPSKGIFYLKSPFDLEVEVYNGLGQFILSKKCFKGVNVLDLSKNASGVYFVRAIEASNVNTYKIIKN